MRRVRAMIVKEMWALLRDRKSRLVLVLPPLLQLFVFTFSTTLDVTNIDVGVLDMSGGVHAREIVQRVEGSPRFRHVIRLSSPHEMRQAIDRQRILAAIVFEPGFDRSIASGKTGTMGLVLDGRKSNATQIVGGYLSQIAAGVASDLREQRDHRRSASPLGAVVTNWYNPSLDFKWFTLPSLVAIIVATAGIAVTSQTVARDRELGTFDQLMVSPLRVHEILIGKMVPPFLVGTFNGSVYLLVAPLIFGVPFTGSLFLFFLALSVFLCALIGVGMLVSALSMTQQQAFLGSFLLMVPLILLSGFASPIANMPHWLQIVTYANPLRYYLIILHGLFLKSMLLANMLHQLWPLVLIAFVTLTASAWLFRARME